MKLDKYIRDIPDFPKKGIIFKDITTLLMDKDAIKSCIDQMAEKYRGEKIDKIIGVEARGFIFGGALSYIMDCGFVPIRKKGKLPYKTISEDYSLEYGTNTIEIHRDSIKEGERVIIVDDLLATGGTAEASVKLVKKLNADIVALEFLIELEFLNGREKLKEVNVNSLIKY
ncbi:MAG: adenine phosphoribosyltransferase [Acidobacteriota bacterium]